MERKSGVQLANMKGIGVGEFGGGERGLRSKQVGDNTVRCLKLAQKKGGGGVEI